MTMELGMDSAVSRGLSGMLLLQSSMTIMDTYSALNSSPWTAESFGGDPAKAASCKEYVYHGTAVALAYSAGAAWLSQNWWPLIGCSVGGAYMYWIYMRALGRAEQSRSSSWDDAGSSSSTPAVAAPAASPSATANGNGHGAYPWTA